MQQFVSQFHSDSFLGGAGDFFGGMIDFASGPLDLMYGFNTPGFGFGFGPGSFMSSQYNKLVGANTSSGAYKGGYYTLFGASFAFGGGEAAGAKYGSRISKIPFGPASEDAWKVLNRVDSKRSPLPGFKGGKIFLNDGRQGAQRLPGGATYHEWDLSPNVKGVPRDGRRLVTGSDGSAYYTTDHFKNFIMIRSGG